MYQAQLGLIQWGQQLPDEQMEDNYIDFIMDKSISEEDQDYLAVAEDVSSKDVKKLVKQREKEMIEAVGKL